MVKVLCPMGSGRHCSLVNTLETYVFSSFTWSLFVSVNEPSFLFRWRSSPVVFSLFLGIGFDVLLCPFRSLEVLSCRLGFWPSRMPGSLMLHACSCISAMPCIFSSLWSVLDRTSIQVSSLQVLSVHVLSLQV